jgi:hypothetical protein
MIAGDAIHNQSRPGSLLLFDIHVASGAIERLPSRTPRRKRGDDLMGHFEDTPTTRIDRQLSN